MLPWICLEQNKLIELGDVDRRHWHRPIGELFSIIHFWLCWLWLWLWLCWLWLWLWWWWSSLVMMIADIGVGQCGGLSSLTHLLTAAFDRFFDESTQLAYFLYKLCTLTLIDAFLSNMLLENTWNYQSTWKQLNPPLLNRIQLGNFCYVHLNPIHKKSCFLLMSLTVIFAWDKW